MESKNHRARAQARFLCAQLHPDDEPPSHRRTERRDNPSSDRKTMQLCAQVRRALYAVIPVPGDSLFEGIVVESVEPAPDATRLRIVLSIPVDPPRNVGQLRNRLQEMTGFMRSQIAAQIHRKRVPLLIFDLLPREEHS